MKEANTKPAQPMGDYVPGIRDDEKAALEVMATAKAEFEQARARYEEISSKHQMFVDSAARCSDESRCVSDKIKRLLRDPYENSHKELITLRAEMRESLEMLENFLFLANECDSPAAEAKMMAEKAANKYRAARTAAIEIITDNMLNAAIDNASSLNLFTAMYARVKAFNEMPPMERTWEKLGFDSPESAVLSDVNTRIARCFQSLGEGYLVQMIPALMNEPFDVGNLGDGTPASWHKARTPASCHMARVVDGANPETSATQ